MSQFLCKKPQRPCEMLSAAVLNDPSEMVRQMALPLVAEYRTDRAIEIVARETGLTFSKTYNLYYRRAKDVWRKENEKLTKAFRLFVMKQERLYREQAERCALLKAECEALERQHELAIQSSRRAVGANNGMDQIHFAEISTQEVEAAR